MGVAFGCAQRARSVAEPPQVSEGRRPGARRTKTRRVSRSHTPARSSAWPAGRRASGGERQRHAVSQREGRERPEEPAASANQQQQAEHEQEMVEAREDVLDAEMDVARKDRGDAFALRYCEVRLVRTEHRPEATAVGER